MRDSEVVGRPEAGRAIPVYALTDKGRDVAARLASQISCAAAGTHGRSASSEAQGDGTPNMSRSVSTWTHP